MIHVAWDKKYSVGYERIDNEHKVFIDLVQANTNFIDAQMDSDFVGRHLEELVLYAKFHFFSEENLMIDSQYPHYEAHKEAHLQLMEELEQKIVLYKENQEFGESLIEFIFEWFVMHTLNTDKQLANYLNEYEYQILIKK